MDAALSTAIGQTLRDFRASQGSAVFDRERCGSALLDTHKQHPAAIRAVLAAIDSGGAQRLLGAGRALAAAAIEGETRRLVSDFGVAPELARGAMGAWAVALGVDTARETSRPGGGQTAGGHETGGGGDKTGHRGPTLSRQVLLVGIGAAATALGFLAFQPAPPRPPPIILHVFRWEWLPGDTPASRRLRIEVIVTNPADIAQAFPDFTVIMFDRNEAVVREVRIRDPEPRSLAGHVRGPYTFTVPDVFSIAESGRIAWFETLPVRN